MSDSRKLLVDQLATAIRKFIERGPTVPKVILIAPQEFDALTMDAGRRRLFNWRIFGVEIGPDPRVEQGLAVACDRDLKWLGAFSWNGPDDPGKTVIALLEQSIEVLRG